MKLIISMYFFILRGLSKSNKHAAFRVWFLNFTIFVPLAQWQKLGGGGGGVRGEDKEP